MRRILAILLLSLQLSFPAITALALDGTIDQSGTAHLRIRSEFSDAAGRMMYVNLSGPVDQVIVKDKSGLILDHTATNEGNNSLVYATVPVDYLEFDIVSDSFTAKDGSTWDFDLTLGASENISAFNASLALPEGAVLKSTNGAVQAGGEALIVSWNTKNIDTLHRARLKAGYELTPPAATQDLTVVSVVAALALVVVAHLLLSVRKHSQEKAGTRTPEPQDAKPAGKADALESNSVFRTLDETDKEIVREIFREDGKTTQAHIYLQTHVPKATLSRRLASLENKGLIQRSQKGNRNLVTLTDVLRK